MDKMNKLTEQDVQDIIEIVLEAKRTHGYYIKKKDTLEIIELKKKMWEENLKKFDILIEKLRALENG